MIDEPEAARAALESLKKMLKVDGELEPDDDLWLRLSDVEISLRGVEATAALTERDSVRWNLVVLKSMEVGGQLAHLVNDLLAWYAIPADPAGSNEPAVGGDSARRLRSLYLDQLAVDEVYVMQLRDQLAAFLPTLQEAPP